jgi:hypothetical protein
VQQEVGASHSRERVGLEEEELQLLPPAANQRCIDIDIDIDI